MTQEKEPIKLSFDDFLKDLLTRLKDGNTLDDEIKIEKERYLELAVSSLIKYFILQGDSISGVIKLKDTADMFVNQRMLLFAAITDEDLAQKLHAHIIEWTKQNIQPEIDKRKKEAESE